MRLIAAPRPRDDVVALLLVTLFLAIGPSTVWLALAQRSPDSLAPMLAVVVLLPGAGLLMARLLRCHLDTVLLASTWALTALGMMVVARVRPALLGQHATWVVLGWCAFLVVLWLPRLPELLRRYRAAWFGLACLLVLATFVIGEDPTGSGHRLWLRLAGFTFQPAEALRVATTVFVAGALATSRGGTTALRGLGRLLAPTVVAGLGIALVVLQRDLGPALLIAGSFIGLYFLAGRPVRVLVIGLVVFAIGASLVASTSSTARERIGVWLDPWASADGTGYQSLQALGGLANGDVLGTGPANGVPTLIPAAHTDYPFAVIGEEWGLLGTLGVVALYAVLVTRGLQLARATSGRFERLLVGGLIVGVGLQFLLVTAGTLRLLPLTGITSPFVSYGGSSTLMSWVSLGLIVRHAQPAMRPPSLPIPAGRQRTNRRMEALGALLLLGFATIALGAGYWQVARGPELRADSRVSGGREIALAARAPRGRILDRHGAVLAATETRPDGSLGRTYTELGAVHIVGYFDPERGAIGAEAVASRQLMGEESPTTGGALRGLVRLPGPTEDVQLALDLGIQRAAQTAMNGAPGAAVALDPRTGEVLALVSNPGFDPGIDDRAWDGLRSRPDSPLLNRATQGLYTPGSTFKTVTLASALAARLVEPATAAQCPERVTILGVPVTSRNEPPGKTTRTVRDAYAYSCNTFFATLGQRLGAPRLEETSRAFGLLDAPPFELPSEAGRLYSTPRFLEDDRGLAATAFGQGELELSPLQLALVAAGIANDGVVPAPTLFPRAEPSEWRRALSPEVARDLAQVMEYS
ncbi:MAG: FtsW/RodA/SpoVE family cell cycle protein, partial [Dehalococcoidia bacterium]|nr:FtsW/RodA/SpoVE family cell cycle protein [Dehalococcoidia bacterium]